MIGMVQVIDRCGNVFPETSTIAINDLSSLGKA